MLVLSREVKERILIGPDIIISVEHIGKHKVRIGIDAPPGVKIIREELPVIATTHNHPPKPTTTPTEKAS